ncbi:Murein DD-endopeptidase MepM and murein hydrolase activator NlpD, contain LysM domain [Sphingomonas guangdongensis]|uniref:Murein DD-endopeptidase MepM and murein hydrolase activator NlpD, contain LysM domain n=1 Tax=Sphingomonas guangdongensis TaxID=1141890 RepID=A0A285QGS3_9SPHN|nr:M23 family metallopeptidase [Sphingomonas guangdongensis]SOB81046.1 Murein DD-endopeptidase MepM and murein hydrolase activator NlpD, contain LysM domain [Sphingomonas guangdongensis]
MRRRAARLARVAGVLPLVPLLGGCAAIPAGEQERSPTAVAAAPLPQPSNADQPAAVVLDGPAVQGGVVLGTAPAGTRALTLNGVAVRVAGDGRFLLGFDRDAGASAALVATLADGRTVTRTLTVASRGWRIERLDSLPRISQPSAEFARRRPAELAQIAAARRIDGDADGWRQRFVWPATGHISGLFGAQRIYRGEPGSYHSGVDVAVPTGTPVVAPADGVVILAADTPFTLEGNLLMIDHGYGLNSAFLHLSRIDVAVGQRVRQGQSIGAVGATGRATGPHLHWGMKWNEARIDPLLVAGEMSR